MAAPEPVRASILLDLEGQRTRPRDSLTGLPPAISTRTGIRVRGLDARFAELWHGGRVLAIGTLDADERSGGRGKSSTPLPIHLLAAALIDRFVGYPDNSRPGPVGQASSNASTPPTVYVIAPHTSQTIPLLYALLANSLSDSHAAIELLKPVRLLQYFDLAGLAESVAEVSDGIYRRKKDDTPEVPECNDRPLKDIILIQGVEQTVSATHRRSGLVQANALLAGLTRSVTQLSRTSGEALVILDFTIEVDSSDGRDQGLTPVRPSKHSPGLVLDSAFSGPNGEELKMICGHETLARTLDAVFDTTLVVHDAFGRAGSAGGARMGPQERVVEVVKDRVGDTTGLWGLWKPS